MLDLLHPYALLGGLVTLSLFPRARRDVPDAAYQRRPGRPRRRVAVGAGGAAAVLMAAFVAWTLVHQGDRGGVEAASAVLGIGAVGLAGAAPLLARHGAGRAFAASAGAIVALFCSLFCDLFPAALRAVDPAHTLLLRDAASGSYTLVMTVVAGIFVPVVLLYQGWTYWVFRHRLGRDDFEGDLTPAAVLSHLGGGGK